MTMTEQAISPLPAPNGSPASSGAEDERDLGPAMQRLTVRQREFVNALLQGCTQKEAARRAGYSANSEGSLEVEGTRQAHKALVQAAIQEEGFKLIRSNGPKSIAVLASIAANTGAKDRDRIAAAVALLDRGGFGSISSHRVDVHHHEPSEEVSARLAAACSELGFTSEMTARALRVSTLDLAEQADGSFSVEPEAMAAAVETEPMESKSQ